MRKLRNCTKYCGIVNKAREELQTIDRRSRTVQGGIHPRSGVIQLCTQRSADGTGFISIEDVVRKDKSQLSEYVTSSISSLGQTVKQVLKLKRSKSEKAEKLMKWK